MASGMLAGGSMREERAANLLDGGMPFYDLYETSDGRHMSVGPLEPQFYEVFVKLLGIAEAPDRYDFEHAPELRRQITEAFAARTQAEWSEVFEGTDACVAPILPLSEAMEHPHMVAREVFVEHEGVRQPAPAPRFSRTTASLSAPPPEKAGIDTREALAAWGIEDVDGLIDRGVAVQA
jgi:alpha-methylacyl-CoA racemase